MLHDHRKDPLALLQAEMMLNPSSSAEFLQESTLEEMLRVAGQRQKGAGTTGYCQAFALCHQQRGGLEK